MNRPPKENLSKNVVLVSSFETIHYIERIFVVAEPVLEAEPNISEARSGEMGGSEPEVWEIDIPSLSIVFLISSA